MQRFERYSGYKDSGVDWIGDIPAGWEVKRLKNFIQDLESGVSVNASESENANFGEIGVLKTSAVYTYSFNPDENKKVFASDLGRVSCPVKKGKIIISRMNAPDLVGASGFVYQDFPNLFLPDRLWQTVFSNIEFEPYWLSIVLTSIGFRKVISAIASGSSPSMKNISKGEFLTLRIPFPHKFEQTAIANFLDEKTTKIDTAIAQKEEMISLLKERKQILIQKAITKGIDPDAQMKDSGVEWIGKIPEHWEVRRSKYVFTQRTERARKDDVQLSATQAYGVIPQDEYESKIGRKVVKIQFHLDKRKHVELNDFVISMRSFQGGLERAWSKGCIRSSYIVLQPLEKISAGFYSYLFKSTRYIYALQSTGNFIRDGQDLNFVNFSMVDLFIPPLEGQNKIAKYIETLSLAIEKSIDLQQTQITKLKEYKTILIDNAVTGKIKVA